MGAPRSRTPGRALPTFVLAAALVVWSHARHAVTHLDATELESFASSDDAADFFIQAFSPPAAHGLTQPGQAVEKNSSAGTGMIADGTHANGRSDENVATDGLLVPPDQRGVTWAHSAADAGFSTLPVFTARKVQAALFFLEHIGTSESPARRAVRDAPRGAQVACARSRRSRLRPWPRRRHLAAREPAIRHLHRPWRPATRFELPRRRATERA